MRNKDWKEYKHKSKRTGMTSDIYTRDKPMLTFTHDYTNDKDMDEYSFLMWPAGGIHLDYNIRNSIFSTNAMPHQTEKLRSAIRESLGFKKVLERLAEKFPNSGARDFIEALDNYQIV